MTPDGKGGWTKSIEPWLPVVGSVATAIIDKSSQDAANKANAQNVDKQIEFQRDQNATAYQRAVEDLKKAGLNPALAYKQGGADSGSGAAAERRPFNASEKLAAAVNAYQSFATGNAQRELLRAQTNQTDAQTRKTTLEGNVIQPQANLGTAGDYINDYMQAERARVRAGKFTAENTPRQFEAALGATMQTTATARQQAALMKSQQTLNEQEFMNAWFRKNIAPYINSTAKTMDGLGSITRAAKGAGIQPHARYY